MTRSFSPQHESAESIKFFAETDTLSEESKDLLSQSTVVEDEETTNSALGLDSEAVRSVDDEQRRFGVTRSLQDKARKFYSTTSSVYAEHTISNPNTEQLLFCISTVLQSQIFEDLSTSVETTAMHSEFNVSPSPHLELVGQTIYVSGDVHPGDVDNDEELNFHLAGGRVPTVDTIYSYLDLLKEQSGYPTECNIIALIYTNRLSALGRMSLTMQNWRAIWAVSVILAQKMWDDIPLKTSSFAQILPSFSKSLLRNLELNALTLLQFSTGVKPSLYAQYYFELRSLFFEIHGTSFDESSHWTLKPLSIIKARRLEDRSSNVWGKSKSKTSSSSSIRSDVSTESGSTHHSTTGSRCATPKISSPQSKSSVSATKSSAQKGWQSSSSSQSNAYDRMLMIDQHEESKEKNFNPYVLKERQPYSGGFQEMRSSLDPHKTSKAAGGMGASSTPSTPVPSSYVTKDLFNDDKDEFAETIVQSPPVERSEEEDEEGCIVNDGVHVQFSSTPSPKAINAERYVFWESLGCADRVVRTYEDITLTDTSRYVLS